eukprot:TRINITY_DN774072_c0_g1_i1.p1 TRINITY_DN774072_c0_g1~~TRINITY_DN774072_c0_g1_i1.p1  ORF type:complete len:267 (+),score=60.37 TRINITY_DN774072_c0_g1_i1:27-803(+)
MIVICLEGCHGVGKTAICKEFSENGFEIFDEGFLDMPDYALHPQSLLMETTWVCHWFERVLKTAKANKDNKKLIYIADRSPFSAVFYSRRRGELLEPIIREQIQEVYEAAGIAVVTVHVSVMEEILWGRIQNRLKVEPERVKYDEDKREWMEKTLSFYNGFSWDCKVSNEDSPFDCMLSILKTLSSDSLKFRGLVRNHLKETLGSQMDNSKTPCKLQLSDFVELVETTQDIPSLPANMKLSLESSDLEDTMQDVALQL